MTKTLLIDDDVRLSTLYANIFNKNGYSVSCATNSHEAICYLKNIVFDIVLIDYNLGIYSQSGIELTKIIRKTLPKSKIAIITNHIDEKLKDIAINNGANKLENKINIASPHLLLKFADLLLELPSAR